MKKIVITILFVITSTLILMHSYTPFYINSALVHYILLCIAVITFIFIITQIFGILKSKISQILIVFIIAVLCFIHAFLSWGGDWKTQRVLYQNTKNSNQTIDFQMRGDHFAIGYKKRIICRKRILPGFDWNTDIDTAVINKNQWKRVDLYVNELKLASEPYYNLY